MMMTKNINNMIDFLCQIEILLLNMFKLLKVFFQVSKLSGYPVLNIREGFPNFEYFKNSGY